MPLLVSAAQLAERRAVATDALAPLANSLASELERAIAARVTLPREKGRLTRQGGRCANDGTVLDFDPYSPHEHRCRVCGAVYRGEDHDRWWIVWYQLWAAERAVHGALLHALLDRSDFASFADDVLGQAVERYLNYPNADNVLGPTRPFFSTYLESIWLLQLSLALDLREQDPRFDRRLGDRLRERVIEPSSALIASYDEGASNRQVWNSAAMLAAAGVLQSERLAREAIEARSGLLSQLCTGLLSDGTWYEGENYHLFAVRGLWYSVAMAEQRGLALDPDRSRRFREAFATPFVSALPDFTFPSRRDSQYAVSLRQWRIAELAELGLARSDDDRLSGAVRELYRDDVPAGDTGRWRSTADAERNELPVRLDRASLGWRSLIFARPELPMLRTARPRSALLSAQGLAILRRDDGALYAALDYGHHGGGHGHPDRLNVILSHGAQRWLDDPGTGSYVDPSLAWYRSSLAHNAPMPGWRTQPRASGTLVAWEDRGAAGWADATVQLEGATLRRGIVAMPDYLLDELRWTDCNDGLLLPIHVDGDLVGVELTGSSWPAHAQRDPGFAFTSAVQCSATFAEQTLVAVTVAGFQTSTLWLVVPEGARIWRFECPGPPGAARRRSVAIESPGREGVISTIWNVLHTIETVTAESSEIRVRMRDGSAHHHSRREAEWHIEILTSSARSSIDLGDVREDAAPPPDDFGTETSAQHAPLLIPRHPAGTTGYALTANAARIALGEAHYRRSETSWLEAGRPTADVSLALVANVLYLDVHVHKPLDARAPVAENPLDNEHPDTNSDGVQIHLGGRTKIDWLLVPEPEGSVRVSSTNATPARINATWSEDAPGWRLRASIELPDGALDRGRGEIDLVVNEIVPGRARRRGQLALSGGGDYVYLQGNRAPPRGPVSFVVIDV